MKATKVSNHWLLEADGFLTETEERTIEGRSFFKTIRVAEEYVDSYREATTEEIAEWEEYKRKQEEFVA